MTRPKNTAEIPFDQRDPGAFNGDIGAGPHGNTHIRRRQRRGVVDTIARHCDGAAFGLKARDKIVLVLGAETGVHFVDAQCRGDRLRRGLGIAGGHDDAQAGVMQTANGLWRSVLDRVRNGHQPGQRPVDGNEHGRLAVGLKPVQTILHRLRRNREIAHQRRIAKGDARAIDGTDHPLARHGFEILRLRARGVTIFGAGHDSLSQGMFGAPLQRGGQAEQMRALDAVDRLHVSQAWATLGQGAGLVDDQHVDLREALQRLGVADQHAGMGAAPRGHHDRHRRGQAQCTGAGNDQHGYSGNKRIGKNGLRPEDHPKDEGENGRSDDRGHKVVGDTIRHRLNRGPRPLSLGDHGHDARQGRVRADRTGLHHKAAGLVQCAARHAVT